jgi:hypothetical protein
LNADALGRTARLRRHSCSHSHERRLQFLLQPGHRGNPGKSTGVLLGTHNQNMERFLIFRQPLVEMESAPGNALPGAREEEARPEAQTETSSKLGALLVVLTPFAVAAWVAIGFLVYRLLT